MLQFGKKLMPPGTSLMYKGKSKFYLARPLNRQDSFFAFAGESPLHFAAQYGSIEIVELIFDRVQNQEPLTIAGIAPLGIACAHNSPDVGKSKLLKALLSQYGRVQNLSFPALFSLSVEK